MGYWKFSAQTIIISKKNPGIYLAVLDNIPTHWIPQEHLEFVK